MIEDLPRLTPDTSRSAKTVGRCHDLLAARRRRVEARNRLLTRRMVGAERLLAMGVCVAYLIAMAGDLLTIATQR